MDEVSDRNVWRNIPRKGYTMIPPYSRIKYIKTDEPGIVKTGGFFIDVFTSEKTGKTYMKILGLMGKTPFNICFDNIDEIYMRRTIYDDLVDTLSVRLDESSTRMIKRLSKKRDVDQ